MSRYSGMSKVKITESGNYLRPGLSSLLEIQRVYEIAPGYNLKTYAFAADLDVIECTATSSNAESHVVGEGVNFFRACDPAKENMWLPDVKAFLLAACGIDHKRSPALVASISDADFDAVANAAVAQHNPFEGCRVYVDTIGKATRPTAQNPQGGTFTKHMWSPATETRLSWAEIKARVLTGKLADGVRAAVPTPAVPNPYTTFQNGYGWDGRAWVHIGKDSPLYLGTDR